MLVVDGTLVPTRDRSVAASSKNHRYPANMQVLIKAHAKLVLAVGRPLPGNHNDCTAAKPDRNDSSGGRRNTTPPTGGCGHVSSTSSPA